ncbi:pilus assembly protein PilM [Lutibacter sp. B2]|nr:pilus assembly protein PilM [Lutibacter sp. B2]
MQESIEMKINPHETIFALDIGTNSVVGIVGKKEGEDFVIIDFEVMEHPTRAMYDGQIQDIDKVAIVAKTVKERLEKRVGYSLKEVAIAAAGRALKTCSVSVNREMDSTKEIDQSTIKSLEIEAIQKAQEMLDSELDQNHVRYYCVGYTVINYYLNENIMISLKGHKGNTIKVNVLATFLPYEVVDSLYTVMNKIGLEVIHLTLEPIAAIHVAIPPKFRLLNLALVDIGAGTSDIALTKDGVIISYAMAPVAGDEITEAIVKEFLLDFDTAEKLKIELNSKEHHEFEDIVGISYTMSTEDIIKRITYAIENLAQEIAERILKYNDKAPSAVFCIGGGSQIPMLTECLAKKLEIKPERVVVRGTEIIDNIKNEFKEIQGPEFITPIGIASISIKERENNLVEILLNGEKVKLLKTKKLVVSDALIRTGFKANKLISKRGKTLEIIINGHKKVVSGKLGKPAMIYVNGRESSLDVEIHNGDIIKVQKATDGMNATLRLSECIQSFGNAELIKECYVNGSIKPMDYLLNNGDEMDFVEIDFNKAVTSKEEEVSFEEKNMEVFVNEEKINLSAKVDGPIFVDIFDHIDFDRTRAKGQLIMTLNGNSTNFTEKLKQGDKIEIYWA